MKTVNLMLFAILAVIIALQTSYLLVPSGIAIFFDFSVRPIVYGILALAVLIVTKNNYPLRPPRAGAYLRHVAFFGFVAFAAVVANAGEDGLLPQLWVVGAVWVCGEIIRVRVVRLADDESRRLVSVLMFVGLTYGYLGFVRDAILSANFEFARVVFGVLLPVLVLSVVCAFFAHRPHSMERAGWFGLSAAWVTTFLVAFIMGLFVIYPRVLNSDAMAGTIESGSVILIRRVPQGVQLSVGDVVHVYIGGFEAIHRVVALDGGQITTSDGRDLAHPLHTLDADDVLGVAIAYIPFLGVPSIMLQNATSGLW